MMKFHVAFLLALFPLLATAHAQDEEKHPIDSQLEREIEANPSTAGMMIAFESALARWDTELNLNYKKLVDGLDRDAADKLRESQRKWVEWRDLEINSLSQFYSGMSGTMWRPIAAESQMEITRQRAITLGNLVEMMAEREF